MKLTPHAEQGKTVRMKEIRLSEQKLFVTESLSLNFVCCSDRVVLEH